jgi:hypothetical protein
MKAEKTSSSDLVFSQSAVVVDNEPRYCGLDATCVQNIDVVFVLLVLVAFFAAGWFLRAVIGRGVFSLTDL